MSRFWRRWLITWAEAVSLFGVVVAAAAFPATDAPGRALLGALGGQPVELTPVLRFAFGLMGCVTLGWGLTLTAVMLNLPRLGDAQRPVLQGVLIASIIWFASDSAISILTGFGLNAASNTVLLIGLIVPLAAGGVLTQSRPEGQVT